MWGSYDGCRGGGAASLDVLSDGSKFCAFKTTISNHHPELARMIYADTVVGCHCNGNACIRGLACNRHEHPGHHVCAPWPDKYKQE